MDTRITASQCAFDALFTKHVPHILEKIFFHLDYESFKTCHKVNSAWKHQLASTSSRRKAKAVFHEEILEDESRLLSNSASNSALLSHNKRVKELKRLLSYGTVDVNCNSYRRQYTAIELGFTPLCYASFFSNHDAVKLLLENGADCNKRLENGMTALHVAAAYGDMGTANVVKILLDGGAVTDKKDQRGLTPLDLAVHYRCEHVVKILKDAGAETSCDHETRHVNITDTGAYVSIEGYGPCHEGMRRHLLRRLPPPNAFLDC